MLRFEWGFNRREDEEEIMFIFAERNGIRLIFAWKARRLGWIGQDTRRNG